MTTDIRLVVPEVSLLTSWYVDNHRERGRGAPAAISLPLRQGIGALDLYFLDHSEIDWYAEVLHLEPGYPIEPHAFAASLTPGQIEAIGRRFTATLTREYTGRAIGRRPRFVALATYFPALSQLDDAEGQVDVPRHTAVQAVRNALYLASCLGVRCVEIVGGARVPSLNTDGVVSPQLYARQRLDHLARSLCDIYDLSDETNPLRLIQQHDPSLMEASEDGEAPLVDGPHLPDVCMELEPGESFLMNSLQAFEWLRVLLPPEGEPVCQVARNHLRLNLDVAHCLMLGLTPADIEPRLSKRVGHFHISDHACDRQSGGGHASDLPPGCFHTYDDCRPWLELALRLATGNNLPSGAVSVELEACCDLSVALAAVGTTRRWLGAAAERRGEDAERQEPRAVRGALLALDLANSTSDLITLTTPRQPGYRLLEEHVEGLCEIVNNAGGSVMSFTGDGIIAFFEQSLFTTPTRTAREALGATRECCDYIGRRSRVTLRAALHFGEVFVPTSGRLREQAIGVDVVIVTRVCDWLGKIIEPAQKPDQALTLIAATEGLVGHLPRAERESEWERWGVPPTLKGVKDAPVLYLGEHHGTATDSPGPWPAAQPPGTTR